VDIEVTGGRNGRATRDIAQTLMTGEEIGPSPWLLVSQAMIDRFADATLDPDPMHIDPDWAKANGPFGGTIAFGFLTMSLLTHLLHKALGTDPNHDASHGYYLNYGFDRLRLVSPVPVGARVRGLFRVSQRVEDERGRLVTTFDVTVEVENAIKPALVAQWLAVWVPPSISR
jgi:acyl dehydratase